MSIIVVGSINMDVVARTATHPMAGQTVLGNQLRFIAGGKGSNQAIAAARAGGDVRLVGKLGQDAFGKTLEAFLHQEALNLDDLTFSPNAPTGTAIIVVDEHGENTIVVIPGANHDLHPAHLSHLPIHPGDFVLAQFEIPLETIHALFTLARSRGATTVLNTAPAMPCSRELLEQVDYWVLNEVELALYGGETVPPQDHDALTALALRTRVQRAQTMVVTLGAEGVLCVPAESEQAVFIPAHRVQAVDTTGAGDCFVGAFVTALRQAFPLESALRFANAAAALSVQTEGASLSMPTRQAIEAFLHG